MKIATVEALALKFPTSDYYGGKGRAAPDGDGGGSSYSLLAGWRGVYSDKTETCLIKITTDSGLVGYGEAQAPIVPEVAATIVGKLLRPMLVGQDPLASEVLHHTMYQSMNLRGHTTGFMLDAISGIDIALWDIRGKHFGVPAACLMGGAFRTRLPAYVSGIRGSTIDDKIATVRDFQAKGFQALKVFVGFGLNQDVEMVEALRAIIAKDGMLAVDSLWNYDVNHALRLGRHLDAMKIAWYEAPTDPEDVDGNADLARALDVPIANGEAMRSSFEFLAWLQKRALDIVQPDIGRTGITEGRRILDIARCFHTPATLHISMCSAPLLAASLQVAAATHNVMYTEYQPVMLELVNSFLKKPIECRDGHFILPDGPGLGIELDEQRLRSFAVV